MCDYKFEQEIDKILVDLKVISNIPPNGKIYIENDTISVDHNTFISVIYRYWYQNNRIKTIVYLKNLYKEIKNISDEIMDNRIKQNSNKNIYQKDYIIFINYKNNLIYIKDGLIRSKFGLKNLVKTYHNDSIIVEELSNIILIADEYISKIKNIIDQLSKT